MNERRRAVDVVLTDIEGTTSSVAVVTRQMFPYARARLRAFVGAHALDPEVAEAWRVAREVTNDSLPTADAFAAQLERWSDEDRKIGPLKTIQGLVWERGFAAGELLAHVFADVPPALREWRARGIRLAVFSSGSVRAQRTFFSHTDHGDLGVLFEAHFDTGAGAKGDPSAYSTIASRLGAPPERILFLSDVAAELDAAASAGMHAIGVARDGSTALLDHRAAGGLLCERFDAIDVDVDVDGVVSPSLSPVGAGTQGARIIALAHECHARGLVWATSGNFSARLASDAFLITASGFDKGTINTSDLLVVDRDGAPAYATTLRPSAETPLHAALYRRSSVGAVAHTHSVAATVLSRQHARAGALRLRGYEMAKALAGVTTHEHEIVLPIVPNDQDTRALAMAVEARLAGEPSAPAYLVEGHGLTTWGADVASVRRHVEALELMLSSELHLGCR